MDKKGNTRYIGSERNFNIVMATAADTVIVHGDKIVEAGEIWCKLCGDTGDFL